MSLDNNPSLMNQQTFIDYAKDLAFRSDQIEVFFDVLDSIHTMLERNNIRAKALEWDQEGASLKEGRVVLPVSYEQALLEIVKDNQLCNLFLPEDMGGFGFSNVMMGPICELISRYDFSLKIITMSGIGILDPLLRYYKPAFDDAIYGFAKGTNIGYAAFTEPQAGSHLKNIKATSELVGDEYLLNGTKIYISNGGYANTGLFLANNIVDGKKDGTNVFLVEGHDGITTLHLEKKSGIRANPTAQLLFENVNVPKESLIGEVGQGYNKVLERLMGMRVAVSFQALAALHRSYDLSQEYANTREQFGRPIIAFEDISRKVKSIEAQIPRVANYAYLSAYALDRKNKEWDVDGKRKPINETLKMAQSVPLGIQNGLIHYYVSSSKLYCSEIANYVLYDAQQIFGGIGFISEAEINKLSRDVRILSIFDGTSEIHHWVVNRAQQVIASLMKFQRPFESYQTTTPYEDILFTRFPDLRDKI
jgi:alkylation response protein AidB-like acyl-CoA dehydrogenase